MIRFDDVRLNDLLGDEVLEVDNSNTGVGLVTDEEIFAVVFTLGFTECRMVRVGPGKFVTVAVARFDEFVAFIAISKPLPGFGGEDSHVFQDAHAGNTDHDNVSTMAPRGKQIVVVEAAGWHVSLQRRRHIGLAEISRLHQFLQTRTCRPGRSTRLNECQCRYGCADEQPPAIPLSPTFHTRLPPCRFL